MNYVASIAYGVAALLLLFALAWMTGDVRLARIVVLIAGLAWVSAYMGYVNDIAPNQGALDGITWFLSLIATCAAVFMYFVVLLSLVLKGM